MQHVNPELSDLEACCLLSILNCLLPMHYIHIYLYVYILKKKKKKDFSAVPQ